MLFYVILVKTYQYPHTQFGIKTVVLP